MHFGALHILLRGIRSSHEKLIINVLYFVEVSHHVIITKRNDMQFIDMSINVCIREIQSVSQGISTVSERMKCREP